MIFRFTEVGERGFSLYKGEQNIPSWSFVEEFLEHFAEKGMKQKGASVPTLNVPVLMTGIAQIALTFLRENTELPHDIEAIRQFDEYCKRAVFSTLVSVCYKATYCPEEYVCEICSRALEGGNCLHCDLQPGEVIYELV